MNRFLDFAGSGFWPHIWPQPGLEYMETVETRVLKSSFSGIKGAKKEPRLLEKSSQSFLGPGCREFESRHSDHKSRKSICSLGFYLLLARLERSNRNMPVAYCCHQCKHWWLPLSAPTGADANESRHSDQNRQFSLRKLAVLSWAKLFSPSKISPLHIKSNCFVPSSTLVASWALHWSLFPHNACHHM